MIYIYIIKIDIQTSGQTDGRTDSQTSGQTDKRFIASASDVHQEEIYVVGSATLTSACKIRFD